MISIIVVDYKSISKTIKYIENLYEKLINPEIYHFIIVDNYKSNDALKELKNKSYHFFKITISVGDVYVFNMGLYSIEYINSGDNIGFARGNNIGTIVSDELFKDDYYIISNNDLSFSDQFDFSMFKKVFDQDDKIAVIGPRIIGLDGLEQSPYKKMTPFEILIEYQWTRFWPFHSKGDLLMNQKSGYYYRVMGCFMLIKAAPFKEVERFDSNTFMFGEEMILSERLEKKGFKTFYCSNYTVLHEHGVTVKNTSTILQTDDWCFNSELYYCKAYRNIGCIFYYFAVLNRFFNRTAIVFKEFIKKLLLKENKFLA